jgi:hypothetical protein
MVSLEIKENTLQDRAYLEEILQKKITEKNYLAAIRLAQTMNLPQEKIRNWQELALKQMALEYRNAVAVRNLAQEWGYSKVDLAGILEAGLQEYERMSEKKCLEEAYDITTGKYLTLRQWVSQLLNGRSK